jgi:ABC-type multidrug transport system fused ATPase/permease subunit
MLRKINKFSLLPSQNFVFSFLLSSRSFIQPHELLGKLSESLPEDDESLERMVALLREWTRVSRGNEKVSPSSAIDVFAANFSFLLPFMLTLQHLTF